MLTLETRIFLRWLETLPITLGHGMETPDEYFFGLSYDLHSLSDRRVFLSAAAASLSRLLPVDHLGWIDADPTISRIDLVTQRGAEDSEIVAALLRTAPLHPVGIQLSSDPTALRAIRLSDLIPLREWKRHVVYNELFKLMGTTFQVTLPVLPYQSGLQGWVFNRSNRDFSDGEIEFANRMRPLLVTMNMASALAVSAEDELAAAERFRLTPREIETLRLLAGGLTPTQIGYYNRISRRTVEKHLQNVYAKIGAHDRVQAVRMAIRLHLTNP
jgi:DNA-binding CsgD family transcriptional regulator